MCMSFNLTDKNRNIITDVENKLTVTKGDSGEREIGRLRLTSTIHPTIGKGTGTPLQYSCLENPMDGGPGGLQSMGSLRVGHD